MRKKLFGNMKTEMIIYFAIIAFSALGQGLSHNIYSNYFKDAYNITAFQRGLIEFPRELPGMICVFIIAGLSFLGDIKLAIVSQLLVAIGIFALGFSTPPFYIMLIFIFINSLGMHLFLTLEDSIGLSLAEKNNYGKRMGQYKGLFTAFTMISSIIVFLGFRYNIFSFTTEIKWIFVLCGITSICVLILLLYLNMFVKKPIIVDKKINFIFKKKYAYYYILSITRGVQKQIMVVFGPWLLIDLLNKKADTIAMLIMIGSFLGVFFIPAIGRWLDKYGVKRLLYVDALSFIGVYLVYGILSAGFSSGKIPVIGLPLIFAYSLLIIDRMSMQMGIVRTVYLKTIVEKESDITPTISLGISMDHIVSIICAFIGGVIWDVWGPQYIFFLAAFLSFFNLYVAIKVNYNN